MNPNVKPAYFHELMRACQGAAGKKPPLNVLLLCSPSAGSITSWVPIIYFLSLKYDIRIHLVFGKRSIVDQWSINPLNQKIIDFFVVSYMWKVSDSVWARFLKPQYEPSDPKILTLSWANVISGLFKKSTTFVTLNVIKKLNIDIMLYDVYEETKGYLKDLFKFVKDIPKASISHGLNPYNPDWDPKGVDDFRPPNCIEKTLVILKYSDHVDWTDRYFPAVRKAVVGWPTCSRRWLKVVRHLTEKKIDEEYILLCSRGSNDKFFSRSEKKHLLTQLSMLCRRDGYKLIIKPHPKEMRNGRPMEYGLIVDALGHDAEGVIWEICESDLGVLAENAKMVVSVVSASVVYQTFSINRRILLTNRSGGVGPALKRNFDEGSIASIAFSELAEDLLRSSLDFLCSEYEKFGGDELSSCSVDKVINIIEQHMRHGSQSREVYE